MQRLELQHRGKLLGATQLVPDHIGSNFRCKRKRKSHKSEDFTERPSGCQSAGPFVIGIGLEQSFGFGIGL